MNQYPDLPTGIFGYAFTSKTNQNFNDRDLVIFSINDPAKLIDLSKVSDHFLGIKYREMGKILSKYRNEVPGSTEWKTTVDELENIIDYPKINTIRSQGDLFWNVTKELSYTLMKIPAWGINNQSDSWAKLLGLLGIHHCLLPHSEPKNNLGFKVWVYSKMHIITKI